MAGAYQSLKEEAYEANMEIPKHDLAVYTWGNVSAFDAGKSVFAIKPSGIPYSELTSDAMVVVHLDGKIVEGKLRPSSDTQTHIVLYKEFAVKGGCKVGGIIHTHSPAAVGWHRRCAPFRSSVRRTPITSKRKSRVRPIFQKKPSNAITKKRRVR